MAIVIDLKMQNAGTDRALSRLEKALDRLDAALNRVNKAIGGTAGAVNGLAGNLGSSGGRGGGSRTRKPTFNSMQDEIAWLRQQPGWRAQAQADQLQRRMAASNPQNQLQQALMRSRFGKSGGKMNIMPLGRDLISSVGPQLLQMMGLGDMGAGGAGGAAASTAMAARAAALSTALNIATTSVTALAAASYAAASAMNSWATGRVKYGGSMGQYTSAARIASLTGVGPDAFSGNLPGTVTGAGVNPLGGPFGDMNYSEKLRRATQFVRQGQSLDQMRRRAALMGSPDLAQFGLLRPDQQRWAMRGNSRADMAQARKVAQLMADLKIALDKLTNALVRFMSPFISLIGKFMKLINSFEERSGGAGKKLSPYIDATNKITGLFNPFDPSRGFIGEGLGKIFDWFTPKDGKKNPVDRALNDNTQATDQLTRTMKDVREVLGGGKRAQDAIPRGFREGISGHLRDLRLANI